MFGQTYIIDSYYTVRTFRTSGSPLVSFFFRLVSQAAKIQNIDLSMYTYNQLVNALGRARDDELVDLSFINLAEGSSILQIKQLISLLPPRFARQLFFGQYYCPRCRSTEQCVVFNDAGVRCGNCQSAMQCKEPAVIAFGEPENKLKTFKNGATYYLYGVYTGGPTQNYSVLVDYEQMKENSDKVYVLESMPDSTLAQTMRAPGQLAYLKRNKLDYFVKTENRQVAGIIGRKLLFCWHNYKQLPEYVREFYQQDDTTQSADLASEPVIKIATHSPQIYLQREPQRYKPYQPVYTLKIVSYNWILYTLLALAILTLFATMIVQSVLIHRTRTTFSAQNVQAAGTAFLGVAQVQRASQMQAYADTAPITPLARKFALNSRYTAYFGANYTFSSLKADNYTFYTIEIANSCTSGSLLPPRKLTISRIAVKSLLADNVETSYVTVGRKLSSANDSNQVFTVQQCQLGDLTTKVSAHFEAANSSVVYAPTLQINRGAVMRSFDVGGQLTAQQCDISANANISGQLTAARLVPYSRFDITNLGYSSNQATTSFSTSAGRVNFAGAQVLLSPALVPDSNPAYPDKFVVSAPLLNVISLNLVYINYIAAQNLIFKQQALVYKVNAKLVSFTGPFTVTGALDIASLTVNQNCTATDLSADGKTTITNLTAGKVSTASLLIDRNGFYSTVPAAIGSFSLASDGLKTSASDPQATLQISGPGNVTFANSVSITNSLTSAGLVGTRVTATDLYTAGVKATSASTGTLTVESLTVAQNISVGSVEASNFNLRRADGSAYPLIRQQGAYFQTLAQYCEIKQLSGKLEIQPDKCVAE